jgi:phosphonate degradation associated HDIG domain protein
MNIKTADQSADEIIRLYTDYGSADYIGEPVSQLEHAVQSASLARESNADDETVLAAFLHDIGHLLPIAGYNQSDSMSGLGAADHESAGSAFLLERGFSRRLAELVGAHVEAKRFLTYKYPEYLERLSEASRQTLGMQGGAMNAAEARAFEQNPLCELKIQLRRWDEQAKLPGLPVEGWQQIRELIIKHLLGQEKINHEFKKKNTGSI